MRQKTGLAISTTIHLTTALIGVGAWVWAGPALPGWPYAVLLAANVALDVIRARLSPISSPGAAPQWPRAVDLVAAKLAYSLLFLLMALGGWVASWLALALIGRDSILAVGSLWLWRRTGRVPQPTGHERWPIQVFLPILALSAGGVHRLEPLVLLLFALVLTRLPGFWFRFCELLDPTAYHPELPGEPPPAPGWPQALRAALARPSTRLTLAAAPPAMLVTGLGLVWLAGQAPAGRLGALGLLLPAVDSPAYTRLAAVVGSSAPCPGWSAEPIGHGAPILAFFLILPLFLLLPDLVGMQLRETTLRRPIEQPAPLWPCLFTAGTAVAVTVACLAVYVAAGRAIVGPRLDCLLDAYAGSGVFVLNAVLLSIVVLSYPERFSNEPPLFRLQVAGGSLTTPALGLLLGELTGLISLFQAGIAIAVMLLFAGVVTQWNRIRPVLRQFSAGRQ